ncbi:transferase family-domain-containing protein [Penicillium brevicompactum]|uniref:Transferase family-domain-containing protein n=1 Tax=Penicillium brevicompactum TaxID=5074 RepID=A0A9W9UF91_PENBR|nr:transferase family-domain-containing protein [Penicillium brevicompactum]
MATFSNSEELTPLDLLMPKVYITALLTFPTGEPTSVLHENIQNGVEKLSSQLPWISGRVFSSTVDNRPSLKMCWNADTVPDLIDRGSVEQSYAELAASNMPLDAFPPRLQPISVMTEHNPAEKGAPVFAVSYFRFGDDKGLGLYISMHHNVVDATGYTQVVELLAGSIAGEKPILLNTSDRVRRLSRALSPDMGSTSESPEALFNSHPEYSPSPPVFPTEFPSCTSKIFSIPISQLDVLKGRLAEILSTPPTTNTLLSALTWSTITRARLQRSKDLSGKSSHLAMAVNGRRRIKDLSSPSDPYFGNTVVYSLASLQAERLGAANDGESMQHLAQVCQVVADSQSAERVNSQHIAEVYRLAECAEDYRSIFVGWDLFGSADLTITSWADMDFYKMNFGVKLGKPEFLRMPYMEADGVGLILPRRRSEKEVLEVMIMLRRDDMSVFEDLWRP